MNNLGNFSGLVDYSSEEEESEDEIKNEIQRILTTDQHEKNPIQSGNNKTDECDALPLPQEIVNMFTNDSEDAIENHKSHDGRIRSFPHERGVWATYVYIEYKAKPEFLEMIESLRKMSEKHGITLDGIEDFHVSLSRTLKLRHHWIQPFVDGLKAHLRHILRFKIMFQSLEVYENEEKTRTFIGLKVHVGFDNLCKITQKVDTCLKEFKLPLFYKNPSFHLSCAACVGCKAEQIELFMADLNTIFQTFVELYPDCRTLWISDICCKTGNKFFKIPLKSNVINNLRMNKTQMYLLVDYIEKNPILTNFKLTDRTTAEDRATLWNDLALQLNSVDGPQKSAHKWKKSWSDLKERIRKICKEVRTGKEHPLNDLEKRIATLIKPLPVSAVASIQNGTFEKSNSLDLTVLSYKCSRTKKQKSMVKQNQMCLLVDYIEKNHDLIDGKLGDAGRGLWHNLTFLLNSTKGGVRKPTSKWRRSWYDWKCAVKERVRKIDEYESGVTTEGHYVRPLTDLEKRIATLIKIWPNSEVIQNKTFEKPVSPKLSVPSPKQPEISSSQTNQTRINENQMCLLVDFLERNPDLIKGKHGDQNRDALWSDLTLLLNSSGEGAVQKTVQKWKRTWRDIRVAVKMHIQKIHECEETSEGKLCTCPLTQLEKRIAILIGELPSAKDNLIQKETLEKSDSLKLPMSPSKYHQISSSNFETNRIKLNENQMWLLVDYIEKNLDGFKGDPKTKGALWHDLALQLNSTGGAKKTVDKWKKSWSDLKSAVKERVRKVHEYKEAHGEQPIARSTISTIRPLTRLEQRIAILIEKQHDAKESFFQESSEAVKQPATLPPTSTESFLPTCNTVPQIISTYHDPNFSATQPTTGTGSTPMKILGNLDLVDHTEEQIAQTAIPRTEILQKSIHRPGVQEHTDRRSHSSRFRRRAFGRRVCPYKRQSIVATNAHNRRQADAAERMANAAERIAQSLDVHGAAMSRIAGALELQAQNIGAFIQAATQSLGGVYYVAEAE